MKEIKNIIALWSSWQPSDNFPCPSQVARYYWKVHMATNKNKPLFPAGEINDVAAVFAKTKPAAIIDLNKDNIMLKEFALKCKEYKINCRFINDKFIFSKQNILDEIQLAVKNNDNFSLGILLGYPQKSVEKFMSKTIKLASRELNEEYIKSLPVPEFIPPKNWFV